MPGSNPPENGFYTFEDSPYIFEGTEPNENGEQVNNGDGFNQQTGENDFSEYLWMEHMEEFDREVEFKFLYALDLQLQSKQEHKHSLQHFFS